MENPYQSNTTAAYRNQDEKLFRKTLEFYKQYKDREMSLLDLIGMYLTRWLVIGTLMLLLILVTTWSLPGAAPMAVTVAFVSGVFVGVVLGDVRICRSYARLWPMLRRILHWERVELEQLGKLELAKERSINCPISKLDEATS